jgi:hypothetical protein
MSPARDRLRTLLVETTGTKKHSAYQSLPPRVAEFIGPHDAQIRPKYERERFQYITSKIHVQDKSVIDVGSNTGYFAFELLEAGCRNVTAYEGSMVHSEFLKLAVKSLGEETRILVKQEYFDFLHGPEKHDIALLLNVVHHTGDDYGDECDNLEMAKTMMLKQLNLMARYTDVLAFQMGFNWKGDIKRCLFTHGTKSEMIHFVCNGAAERWQIEHIGVAERTSTGIRYSDVNDYNVARDDSLGEFLNRPLFIMRSKHR